MQKQATFKCPQLYNTSNSWKIPVFLIIKQNDQPHPLFYLEGILAAGTETLVLKMPFQMKKTTVL